MNKLYLLAATILCLLGLFEAKTLFENGGPLQYFKKSRDNLKNLKLRTPRSPTRGPPRRPQKSSSSFTTSTSSSSSFVSPCLDNLLQITGQPCLPAITYFENLRRVLEAKAPLIFSNATQIQTVELFIQQYGVSVRIFDAFGFYTDYPITSEAEINAHHGVADVGFLRSIALNLATYNHQDVFSYYTFPIFSQAAEIYVIQLNASNAQIPLATYTF